MSTEEDVRETKPEDFAQYEKQYGPFDCDAACTLGNAKCDIAYTSEGLFVPNEDHSDFEQVHRQDALSCDWGGRVFLNPPFSELYVWIEKCWQQMMENDQVESITCTIPNTRGEQKFWQDLIEPYRDHKEALVPGVKLITDFRPVRKKFLENGKPILDSKGKIGSARFGIVVLHWART